MNKSEYKYDEIKNHFIDFIHDENNQDFMETNKLNFGNLHHEVFNNDYYIIGRHEASKWLGDQVFNVISCIKDFENDNYGKVLTDFSEPEKVVNMYVYIVGESIVSDYLNNAEDFKPIPKIKTYVTSLPVNGEMPISVEATSKEKALAMIHDGQYEENEDFCLGDCEINSDNLKEEDIDELN